MKYLFTAFYNDGTQLQQSIEDVSVKDPLRSAFFDIEHDKLEAFVIANDANAFEVNVITGEFNINGVSFFSYDKEVNNRRLVYFRRHQHDFTSGADEIAHRVSFHLGWQGNDIVTGENIQRVLQFT